MWEAIVNSFTSLSGWLLASQICGLVGFAIIAVSHHFQKLQFLIVSGVSYVFFTLESAFAGIIPSMIVGILSLVRNGIMVYYLAAKKKEMPNWWVIVLLVLTWVATVVCAIVMGEIDSWQTFFPCILETIYTVCANNKNYYVLKAGALVHEVGFLVYYSVYLLPLSVIRQIVMTVSIVISIIRLSHNDLKNRKKSQ